MNDDDILACGHTKKCGWKGRQGDLVFVPDPKSKFIKINRSNGTCPKCGQHKKGFIVVEAAKP